MPVFKIQVYMNLPAKMFLTRCQILRNSIFFHLTMSKLLHLALKAVFLTFSTKVCWLATARCVGLQQQGLLTCNGARGVWCILRFFVWPDRHVCMPESWSPCSVDHFKLWISVFGAELTDFNFKKVQRNSAIFPQKMLELKSTFS